MPRYRYIKWWSNSTGQLPDGLTGAERLIEVADQIRIVDRCWYLPDGCSVYYQNRHRTGPAVLCDACFPAKVCAFIAEAGQAMLAQTVKKCS